MSNTQIRPPLPSDKNRTNKTLNFVSVDELFTNIKCNINRDFLHWYLSKNTNYYNKNNVGNSDHKTSPKFIGVPHNVTFNNYGGNISQITTCVDPLKERLPLPIEDIIDLNGNYKKLDHLISNFDRRRLSRSPRKYKHNSIQTNNNNRWH
uniref:Uncharacterized protein n=1 Tax=Pithovirus LCPAC101 TaxID=2506586 RepID=A0A481Z291_9VIRU|nr:MAG: hypothetical protein LCPAC101_00560 [Pithovirus LCPAC101]